MGVRTVSTGMFTNMVGSKMIAAGRESGSETIQGEKSRLPKHRVGWEVLLRVGELQLQGPRETARGITGGQFQASRSLLRLQDRLLIPEDWP